jgi:acyl-coenzyme A synthetase/AMP-(fatty) acid ligase
VSAGKPPHQGRGEKLALQRLGKNGERRDLTYGELLELSNRFADLPQELAAATGSRSTHGSSKARG